MNDDEKKKRKKLFIKPKVREKDEIFLICL